MTPIILALMLTLAQATEAAVRTIPSFGELLVHWQMPLVIGLSSLVAFATAKISPKVAALGDWTKRGALLVIAMVMSAVVRSIGGEVSSDLAMLFWTVMDGAASTITAGTVFRLAKVQPGNTGDGS